MSDIQWMRMIIHSRMSLRLEETNLKAKSMNLTQFEDTEVAVLGQN